MGWISVWCLPRTVGWPRGRRESVGGHHHGATAPVLGGHARHPRAGGQHHVPVRRGGGGVLSQVVPECALQNELVGTPNPLNPSTKKEQKKENAPHSTGWGKTYIHIPHEDLDIGIHFLS